LLPNLWLFGCFNLYKKEYTIKSMDNYRKTKEWRQHVMNTEEVAEVAKQIGMKKGLEEGRKEGLIAGVQNLISVLRDYGETNQQIL
jgi:flagellar biosynthesis/type III secretory pathway protein FliH